ncbi:MAG: amino acid ABC transporter permease [Rhodospirillales bacterium]|nr:amino acid ABC transporter permease [Rhodospirillales bacterium]QQS11928.1 MAG: amino acid ABC transporter permease [Rhodospirillales bacterium]
MTDLARAGGASAKPQRSPPRGETGAIGWARKNLFNGWGNGITTIVLVVGIGWLLWGILDWGLFRAVFSAPDGAACKQASPDGACWAIIGDKYRLIFFGTYPLDEHWRPLFACIAIIAMLVVSCDRRFWNWRLLVIWGVGTVVSLTLMFGGVLGLSFVETSRWGGLPVTLILAAYALAFAFPLGVLAALGRRSNLPLIKGLCVGYIELIRGVPLISLLIMASVMLPLFLPAGVSIDKFLRALVAVTLFAGAYIAEIVRGGLQSLSKGQYEAADALGLNYPQKTLFVILPQALAVVIPPLVNTFIGFFKDTSLVLIIGIFDLLNAGEQAIADRAWAGFANEVHIFLAALYFAMCYSMSLYSKHLERELNRGVRR